MLLAAVAHPFHEQIHLRPRCRCSNLALADVSNLVEACEHVSEPVLVSHLAEAQKPMTAEARAQLQETKP
eukprot:scaffold135382_cov21-Tisochrysis_lutea.AAC.1